MIHIHLQVCKVACSMVVPFLRTSKHSEHDCGVSLAFAPKQREFKIKIHLLHRDRAKHGVELREKRFSYFVIRSIPIFTTTSR